MGKSGNGREIGKWVIGVIGNRESVMGIGNRGIGNRQSRERGDFPFPNYL